MSALLTIYVSVGAVFFVLAFAVTQFGRAFSSEKFTLKEVLTQLIWLGVLWPVGLGSIIYTLSRPHKPDPE